MLDELQERRLASAARIVRVLKDAGPEWMDILIIALKVAFETETLGPYELRKEPAP